MNPRLPAVCLSFVLLAAAVSAPPAHAHHQFSAEFDGDAPVTLTGAVTQVEWVNPHVWIHMTGGPAGQEPKDWMIEAYTPNALLRQGLDRANLTRGAAVTIRAFLPKDRRCLVSPVSKSPTCKANGRALMLADGKTRFIGSAGDGAPYDASESRDEYDCLKDTPRKVRECGVEPYPTSPPSP